MSKRNSKSQSLRFYKQIAYSEDYPKPVIPMAPRCRDYKFGLGRNAGVSAFLGAGRFYHQGRYALFEALKLAGAGPNSRVLFPAYHCRTMIEPAICLNADIAFYPLTDQLRINDRFVTDFLSSKGANIAAIVVTHYFGFPQDMESIRNVCDQRGIVLIEDCAHAFYGSIKGRELGTHANLAIASPRKFFPIEDGGILLLNGSIQVTYALRKPAVRSELKAMAGCLMDRLRARNFSMHSEARIQCASVGAPTVADEDDEGATIKQFAREKAGSSGLRLSKWMMGKARHQDIMRKRRINYQFWLDICRHLSSARALFPTLADNVVPYVFPMILTADVDSDFDALKKAGVPIQRWEDIVITDCDVSAKYRRSLIQLPCHQDLNDSQKEWLSQTVSDILG